MYCMTLHFTAKPGETTAIIGSTGSGKSTMVNLIPRFYDVTEGKITIDGQDVRDLTQHELRDKLGYVPQKECCSQEILLLILCSVIRLEVSRR